MRYTVMIKWLAIGLDAQILAVWNKKQYPADISNFLEVSRLIIFNLWSLIILIGKIHINESKESDFSLSIS